MENHKLDASELASLEIEQRIAKCENEISNTSLKLLDKNLKREYEGTGILKKQDHKATQIRPSSLEASGSPRLQSFRRTQEQGTAYNDYAAISDSKHAYHGYVANNVPLPSEA